VSSCLLAPWPSRRAFLFLFLAGAWLIVSACAANPEPARQEGAAAGGLSRIAVFPVENLTGKSFPSREIHASLVARLQAEGIEVLDEASLDRLMTKYRVRYTAGVEPEVARALQREGGVEAVLIPSVELYEETSPPRVAIFWRLVSTGEYPALLWIDGTGLAGDDAPGILGLGLIEEPRALLAKATDALARSLVRAASEAGDRVPGTPRVPKFRPKIVYRSEALDPARSYSVAVVPFFNRSERKYAGEIVALHMIRNLMRFQNFVVVEPGIVRQELLRFRIIMQDGVSLPETETILNAVNADLVLNGEVLDYTDPRDPSGYPKVDFSVLFIERKSRKVVYSSYSHNQGNDGVVLFDWGRVNTAHAMAAQMARAIGDRLVLGSPQASAGGGSPRPANGGKAR